VLNKSWLVSFPAHGHRSQKRRVSFDEHAVRRHLAGYFLQLGCTLERDDAGKGNVETKIKASSRHVPVAGEAMHHTARFAGALAFHDVDRVVGGIAGVDDDWLVYLLGSLNVVGKSRALPVEVALAAKIVEPGFTYGDNVLVVSQANQSLDTGVFTFCFVRVYANRSKDMFVATMSSARSGKLMWQCESISSMAGL